MMTMLTKQDQEASVTDDTKLPCAERGCAMPSQMPASEYCVYHGRRMPPTINEGGQACQSVAAGEAEGQKAPGTMPVPPSLDAEPQDYDALIEELFNTRNLCTTVMRDKAICAIATLADERDALQKEAVAESLEVTVWRNRAERAEGDARLWLSEYNRLRQEIADATERCVAHLADRETLYREYIAARTEVEAVKAERDALRADAERYRWLRAAQSQTARNWIVINNRNMYGEHELDAAIDAARKA